VLARSLALLLRTGSIPMKQTALFLSALILLALSFRGSAQAPIKPSTKPPASKAACAFDIIGLWRTSATSEANPIFFNFSREGWVVLLRYSRDALPQEFEATESVNYKLDNSSNPKRIEFTTPRGNEIFVPGLTMLKISGLSRDSFTTRNIQSGEELRWYREQTHRYFLTFAAQVGPQQQNGPAFVSWTSMDGRDTNVEAFGAEITKSSEGASIPVFGPVTQASYEQVKEQNEEEAKKSQQEIAIARFELDARQFEKTREVLERWKKLVKTGESGDPYAKTLELMTKTAETIEPCPPALDFHKVDASLVEQITLNYKPSRRPLEYIRLLRNKNAELHVADRFYPWGWRPLIRLPNS